ncbi:sigma-70 family RNA polymerase sigma factor [Bythopirellula goksoeyrii]|uniref:RNA polymerase sigma factor SigA n=1 Tax=Bythopirellula goksoeyrii TaxID=1400387 RepID=A0A5B9QF05_9BACT|nr:sigma-70 family RNA polymerase sigma factor [Bythopirellula goksoeyrii]QEG37598.1 RNA polymerase sigma factor SigA [Bythopirellula goksoeyrii]
MAALTVITNHKSPIPRQQDHRESDRLRAMNLLRLEIDFIPNREFRAEDTFCDELVTSTLDTDSGPSQVGVDLPAHLKRMCNCDLLTPDQERALFREMNLLKYRANLMRTRIDLDQIEATVLDTLESLLAQSQQIRDHLIKANMRLVMSIVKKFVTPQHSFDDLLSEGVLTLMKAVEKFDFDRGFRFSTYAYRSIMRHVYRTVSLAQVEEATFTRGAEEWAFEAGKTQSGSSMSEQVWSNLRVLMTTLLDQLDRRERFIIRSRYALGSHRKVRTFQYLADKLGVSKERVRQLESRAVSKLQTLAAESANDDFWAAAMV